MQVGRRGPRKRPQRGAGANSRTPAGRLLGQLQPVDGEAVGAATQAAALALALHVTLGLAHVGRLDLVAAVALGAELQPSVQVTPGGDCCEATAAATMETSGTGILTQCGDLGDRRAPGTMTTSLPSSLPDVLHSHTPMHLRSQARHVHIDTHLNTFSAQGTPHTPTHTPLTSWGPLPHPTLLLLPVYSNVSNIWQSPAL